MEKLLDVLHHSNHNLTETVQSDGSKKYFLTGKVQTTITNQNKRRYGQKVWEHLHSSDTFKDRLSKGLVCGGVGHPKDGQFDPLRIATKVVEQWLEGDNVMAKREILPTPDGQYLLTLRKSGVDLGTSSRGRGDSESTDEGIVDVLPGFFLEGYDDVLEPSVKDAFTNLMTESVNSPDAMLRGNIAARLKATDITDAEKSLYRSFCEEVYDDPTLVDKLYPKPDPIINLVEKATIVDNDGKVIMEFTPGSSTTTEEVLNKINIVVDKTIEEQNNKLHNHMTPEEIKQLTESNTQLRVKLSDAANKMEELNKRYVALKSLYVTLESKVKDFTRESSDSKAEFTTLETRHNAAKKIIEEFITIKGDLTEGLNTKSKRYDAAKKVIESLLSKRKAAKKIIESILSKGSKKIVENHLSIVISKFPKDKRNNAKTILEQCTTVDDINKKAKSLLEMANIRDVTLPTSKMILEMKSKNTDPEVTTGRDPVIEYMFPLKKK